MTTVGVASSVHCTYSVCLLIRIKDLHDCQWSGGFPLVNDGSLCVNMRYVCRLSVNHLFRHTSYVPCTPLSPHPFHPHITCTCTPHPHKSHTHTSHSHTPPAHLHPHYTFTSLLPLSSPTCLPTEELWGGACSFGWRLSTKGPLRLSSSLRQPMSLHPSDWRTFPR